MVKLYDKLTKLTLGRKIDQITHAQNYLWCRKTGKDKGEKKKIHTINFTIKYETWLKRCRRNFEPDEWQTKEDNVQKMTARILARLKKLIQTDLRLKGDKSVWRNNNNL